MTDVARRAAEILRERFPEEVLDVQEFRGQWRAYVRRDRILDILRTLRDDPELRFEMLTDLTAVDYLGQDRPERFCVVYQLYSLAHDARFRVKAWVPESDPQVASATPLWKAANWAEREVWDLFGISFGGHPGLKRIMLPESYVGHPLRKDYPLRGRGEREAFPRYVAPSEP
jgi:NADH-quinone oxidoreductase subunit C